ncbi:MAG: hypothetical protein CMF96_10300 [Candidatus Marinimicrobia bacterium]|mgnify:CR=1 FL=1|nr:hypothetical protein [Candidatus Neomarinimicrobiota bacterium]
MDKLVSVIIPSFNQASELKNAILSITNQSYSCLEIVVVDDCSEQNIKQAVESINDNRIHLYKTKKNSGVTEARKLGIVKSKGNYIAFLDQDDTFKSKCIENKINKFSENDNINIVISDYFVNNRIKNSSKINKMKNFTFNFKENICRSPGPFFQSCMIKRELLEDVNFLFDKRATPSEDWDFFINLSNFKLIIGYVQSPDFIWNFSKYSQSANYKKEALGLQYILKKHENTFLKYIGQNGISNHYRMVARVYEKGKLLDEAKGIYRLAFKIYPKSIKNIFYMLISVLPNLLFILLVRFVRIIRGKPLG